MTFPHIERAYSDTTWCKNERANERENNPHTNSFIISEELHGRGDSREDSEKIEIIIIIINTHKKRSAGHSDSFGQRVV